MRCAALNNLKRGQFSAAAWLLAPMHMHDKKGLIHLTGQE